MEVIRVSQISSLKDEIYSEMPEPEMPGDEKPKPWDQAGSISPLIICFFSIILILIFMISNIASSYIARRDLTSRVESALSSAAQELDELRYYYGSPLTEYLAEQGISSRSLRVPIDCEEAARKFRKGLLSSSDGKITVEKINCDGYDISAIVSEEHDLPFQLRVFGITSYVNSVEVGTASFLLSNE